MEFAALMNKAKANTEQQKTVAALKNAEVAASREREAELDVQRRKDEDDRRRKEAEARRKREMDATQLEAKLAKDKERKRLDRLQEQARNATTSNPVNTLKLASTSAAASATSRQPSTLRKKKRKRDALFSDDEEASDASATRRATQKHGGGRSLFSKLVKDPFAADLANLSAKDRLKAQFDPSKVTRLNVNKRDTRTIEEVEADIKRKKDLANGLTPSEDTAFASNRGLFATRRGHSPLPPANQHIASTLRGQEVTSVQSYEHRVAVSTAGPSAPTFGATDVAKQKKKARRRSASPPKSRVRSISPPKSKRRSASPTPIRPAAKSEQRRPRRTSYSPPSPQAHKPNEASRREEIWKIINPNKGYRYEGGFSEELDDVSDDMEAGMDEIEEENEIAERIARREDRAEERRLAARAQEKQEARKRLKPSQIKGKSKG